VIVPLGNGRLTEPAHPPEAPAGGIVCLSAASGEPLWTFSAADAVIQQPAVVGDRIYFGSREGNLYCLALADGAKHFAVPVGGPIISAPAVVEGRVYVASVNGHVRCLDAADGREVWHLDFAKLARCEPRIYAAVVYHAGRVYVAGEFRRDPSLAGSACLYCLPAEP
jgi:outer membrane protein assembly factor BamB